MGRKKKKTGETKTSEPNPFGVKKAPKKKNKKKRKKRKKVKQRESCHSNVLRCERDSCHGFPDQVAEGEMAVEEVLLLAMSQGAKVSSRWMVYHMIQCAFGGRGAGGRR